jgi:hypothetical protein
MDFDHVLTVEAPDDGQLRTTQDEARRKRLGERNGMIF